MAALTSDVLQMLEDLGARTLRVGGVDIDGQWRGKQVFVDQLSPDSTLGHSDCTFGFDIQDQLYDPVSKFTGWSTGWPDVHMVVDQATVRAVPWEPGVATAVCSYVDSDNQPISLCPRTILQRAVEAVQARGLEPDVAVELEFFVFRGRPVPNEHGQVSALTPLQFGNHSYHPLRGTELIDRWSQVLREYGIPVEGSLTEWGESQFEINLKHGSPLQVADDVLMTKHALKALAAREDLTVSFMARPRSDGPGSSGHVHVSLRDEAGANVFFDQARQRNVSEAMLRFAAGLVRDLPETALVALPFVNSYRRVGDYLSSPTRVNVGWENRTTGLRLITHNEPGARIEVRVPGADANPYLVLASTLASGLAGISEPLEPAEILNGDGYADAAAPDLPRSLEEAIRRFDESKRPLAIFGEAFVEHYLHSRRWELAKWREAVTDWEVNRYLETV